MKKLNTKGFGIVEVLLLIVLVGVIGGAVYYVYNSQKKTNESLDNANSSLNSASRANSEKSENKEETKSNVPEGWTQYQDTNNGVSFYYPADWEKDKFHVYKTPVSEIVKGTNFGSYSAKYIFKNDEKKWYSVNFEGEQTPPADGYTTIATSIPASSYEAVYGYTGEGGGSSYYVVFSDGTSSYMIELPVILEESNPEGLNKQKQAITDLIDTIKINS